MRAILCAAAVLVAVASAQAQEEKVTPDKLPPAVKKAVQKRFPKLEIKAASKEKEGEKVVFEVSLRKDGKNIDVTVTEKGDITLIEQEITFQDLPKTVAKTFEEKYPGGKYEIIETVTKVAGTTETLQYYEAKVVAAGKKWEVEILPDGKLKSAAEVKGND